MEQFSSAGAVCPERTDSGATVFVQEENRITANAVSMRSPQPLTGCAFWSLKSSLVWRTPAAGSEFTGSCQGLGHPKSYSMLPIVSGRRTNASFVFDGWQCLCITL